MSCSSKIVVFDLDETLGYFVELGMFWDTLNEYIAHKQIKIKDKQILFNNVLDLYPEFLRPNITNILNYLKYKKDKKTCDKLMIYTNNQGPIEWSKHIINYFETKLNCKIFDQIIGAFKIQGQKIEICRTTHMKTHNDLIKCTKVSPETQICFIDDAFYPDMKNDKIYYINLKPYIHDLEFNVMIDRFINSSMFGDIIEQHKYCKEYMLRIMQKYNYIYIHKTQIAQDIDVILSKKILQHLYTFFKIKPINTNKNTTRRNKFVHNKTLKQYR